MALNIYQRIRAIMQDVDYVCKDGEAAFQSTRYKFVSHDAVTAKLHPYFVKHGIVVIPSVEQLTQEGNRTLVKLLVIFRNVDEPSDCFHTTHFGYGCDSGDKGPGKAVSYAFKYALLKTFCLETGEDSDQDGNSILEPPRCLDFDSAIPVEFTGKDRALLNEFLDHCAKSANKHPEIIKREALTRIDGFWAAFKKWKKK
jgi:hypothetical protein